jgi:hypothetical protein
MVLLRGEAGIGKWLSVCRAPAGGGKWATPAATQPELLAESVQDPALLPKAHRPLGQTWFYLGEFSPAREHLDQAIALYDRAASLPYLPLRHDARCPFHKYTPVLVASRHSRMKAGIQETRRHGDWMPGRGHDVVK